MVKNLSAMQETTVRFQGQEDPLEKGMGYSLYPRKIYRSVLLGFGRRSTTQNESKGPRQAVLLGRFSFRLLPTWGTAFGMIQAMPNEHVLRV